MTDPQIIVLAVMSAVAAAGVWSVAANLKSLRESVDNLNRQLHDGREDLRSLAERVVELTALATDAAVAAGLVKDWEKIEAAQRANAAAAKAGRVRVWSEVEAALQARADYRRDDPFPGESPPNYYGPCPLTGAGTDCAWFSAGSELEPDSAGAIFRRREQPGEWDGSIIAGCNHCGDAAGQVGGRLDDAAWQEHLEAVCGDRRVAR